MSRYLVFPDLSAAKDRSSQQAVAKGCDGTTEYWWAAVSHPTSGQAALVIDDGGDYGPSGLAPAEISALQSLDTLLAAGWFPHAS